MPGVWWNVVGARTSIERPEYVPWWALLIALVGMPLSVVSGFFAAFIGLVAPYEPPSVLLLIVGLLLALGGPVACGAFLDRVLDRRRATDGPGCPSCGYSVRYLPEPRCPECGERWRPEVLQPGPERRSER